MSSQTFKAQMSVGSWASTPLFPGLESITKIIETRMSHSDNGEEDGIQLEVVAF